MINYELKKTEILKAYKKVLNEDDLNALAKGLEDGSVSYSMMRDKAEKEYERTNKKAWLDILNMLNN